jgi:hypothetical protein
VSDGRRLFSSGEKYTFDRKGKLGDYYCVVIGESDTGPYGWVNGVYKEVSALDPYQPKMTFVQVTDSKGQQWWMKSEDVRDAGPADYDASTSSPPASPFDVSAGLVGTVGLWDGKKVHLDRPTETGVCHEIPAGAVRVFNFTEWTVYGYPEPGCVGDAVALGYGTSNISRIDSYKTGEPHVSPPPAK